MMNGNYLEIIVPEAVHNAVRPADELSDRRIRELRHYAAGLGELRELIDGDNQAPHQYPSVAG